MRPRQPLPRLWLVSDERMTGGIEAVMVRLPRGAGVIFRHYRTPAAERAWLFSRAQAIARARRQVLLLAGSAHAAVGARAAGVHGRARHRTPTHLIRSAPAHDGAELLAAIRAGADVVLVSPLFATRSHPGARPLGPVRFGLMVRRARSGGKAPLLVALGGMDGRRFRRLRALGAEGWAAIDALS